MDSNRAMPTAVRRSPETMMRRSSICHRNRSIRLQTLRHCSFSVASRPREGAKRAKGDDVLSEQRSRAHVVDGLHMKLEPLKPAADGGHVILIMAKRMIRRTRDLRTAMA